MPVIHHCCTHPLPFSISIQSGACRSEEIWAPEVNDFILISDSAYTREQILKMEKAILIAGLPRPGR